MITVNRASASNENTFMHLESAYSYVESWTNVHAGPTYLLRIKNEVHFIQFINQAFADEYIAADSHFYTGIVKIESV